MSEPTTTSDVAPESAATPESAEAKAEVKAQVTEPQYVTQEQFSSLNEKLDKVLSMAAPPKEPVETFDPSDPASVEAFFQTMNRQEKSADEAPPAEEDTPVMQRLKKIEEAAQQSAQAVQQQRLRDYVAQQDAVYSAKYPDWKELRGEIWATATRNPNLTGDECYAVVKARHSAGVKAAPKAETPKVEPATPTPKAKPSGAGQDTAPRPPRTIREAAERGLQEHYAKQAQTGG